MKFGLFSMNSGVCSYPEAAMRIAERAEAAGFESLWAGEHIVLPDPQAPPSPVPPDERLLDPLIALTFLAAHTRQIHLGTGVIILPEHNPLVLAKALASLDELCGGRLLFGVGVGYLEAEFRALGVPFADRGARTDDYLAAMRAIWTQSQPAHHGRFVSFEHIQAHPQRAIPVIVGGHSGSAYRRAVEQGNGWYGWALSVAETAHALAKLAKARTQYDRPPDLGTLEISVTPSQSSYRPITLEDVRQYADLGVDRLIIRPSRRFNESELDAFISRMGETVIGRI